MESPLHILCVHGRVLLLFCLLFNFYLSLLLLPCALFFDFSCLSLSLLEDSHNPAGSSILHTGILVYLYSTWIQYSMSLFPCLSLSLKISAYLVHQSSHSQALARCLCVPSILSFLVCLCRYSMTVINFKHQCRALVEIGPDSRIPRVSELSKMTKQLFPSLRSVILDGFVPCVFFNINGRDSRGLLISLLFHNHDSATANPTNTCVLSSSPQ